VPVVRSRLPLLLTRTDERALDSCFLTFRTGLETITFDLGSMNLSNKELGRNRSGEYPPFSFYTSHT